MDPYKLVLAIVGLSLLGAAWLPHLLKRHPLTFPMLYVGFGALLYALPLPLPAADPIRFPDITERLTELTVLVALVGAGLRIDTPFGWRRWRLTWRLLGIAMPLSILAGLLLGQHLLGYGLAAAVLLGAVLAPTDPVLASDVQVAPPGEGKEDHVRFALTSEAGLNDGLAFPFVWLAIALALAASGVEPMSWPRWFGLDLAWRVIGGIAIGWAVGYGLMHVIFRGDRDHSLSATSDGLTALAITLFVYGVAELCHTYGFLAVFVAAVVVRHHERHHEYHTTLNQFAAQCEGLLTACVLILFGGALASGALGGLRWQEWTFALMFVLLVRPVVGWLSMLGTGLRQRERWAIAVFGVRGIGSLYYVAFALNHADFGDGGAIWRVVMLIVLLSVVLHGFSAKPVMAWLDGWRQRGRRRTA
ncbi:MAG: cation:proton antiporter [Lysobacter sp.]|nr:cation:proton antiporter [Lysobacter sp.]